MKKVKEIVKKVGKKVSFDFVKILMAVVLTVFVMNYVLPSPAQSGCCAAVTVTNFPSLVSMQWANLFLKQWQQELQEWLKAGLSRLTSADIFNIFFRDYFNLYNDIYNEISKFTKMGSQREFMTILRGNGHLAPLSLWALESKNFKEFDKQVTNYIGYIIGRQKFLESAAKDLSGLPQYEVDYLTLLLKDQESRRDSISKNIVSAAASLKLAQAIKEDVTKRFNLSAIDTATDKQAIKDLVKLQMLNAQLLSELIKVISEERLYSSANIVGEINARDAEIKKIIEEKKAIYKYYKEKQQGK